MNYRCHVPSTAYITYKNAFFLKNKVRALKQIKSRTRARTKSRTF
nr:MAG TPA: hypothetical protein [Caudoviricetes sp.]